MRMRSWRALRRIAAASAAALSLSAGCGGDDERAQGGGGSSDASQAGLLTADPRLWERGSRPPSAGLHRLAVQRGPEPYLYVPAEVAAGGPPAPLVLALPGSGNDVKKVVEVIRPHAQRAGAVVLGVGFRSGRWDVLGEGFGRDVRVIDEMLRQTFRRIRIDPSRIGAAGYSDGASYALSLGLGNGELIRHVVAFSPGFVANEEARGEPEVYVTHGTEDPVLPIDATSRDIVPELREAGLGVHYREFEGGHKIPHPLLPWALRWLEVGADRSG